MADTLLATTAASPATQGAPSVSNHGTSGPGNASGQTSARGLEFARHFTKPGINPFDEVTWEHRDAVIMDWKGKLVFEQKAVEVPADWSVTATNIVASKYLHGQVGTPERETGVRALISRVAESIRDWGKRDGYFANDEAADIFFAELTHILLHQKAAFNSPVWFNVGCDRLEPNSDAQNWHLERRARPGRLLPHRLHPPAVLGVLHQLRAGLARFHPHPRQDRRHALQVGLRRRLKPQLHPRLHGNPLRRRHRLRPPELHARLRRLRRRHQVRRQNPPRRQNGHPQRRPSRHRRLHPVQSEGRSQGLAPHAGRLRRLQPRQRSVHQHLLPERQQLRPRYRRVHERRRQRRRLHHPRRQRPRPPSRPTRPAS